MIVEPVTPFIVLIVLWTDSKYYEVVMYQISFINQQKTLRVNNGTLADACSTAGLPLNLVCGGKGTCGKCLVSIELFDINVID